MEGGKYNFNSQETNHQKSVRTDERLQFCNIQIRTRSNVLVIMTRDETDYTSIKNTAFQNGFFYLKLRMKVAKSINMLPSDYSS